MSSRRQVNAERTRADLVDAAIELFGTRGFRDVSIDDICQRVELSRGGFYHHFANKEDCVEAVWTKLQEDWAATSAAEAAAAEHLEPWDALRAGFLRLFEYWGDPIRRQINLLDASAALGWDRVRELLTRHSMPGSTELLAALGRQSDPMLAQLVFAAIAEAVFHVGSPEHRHDAEMAADALVTLISSLPPSPDEQAG